MQLRFLCASAAVLMIVGAASGAEASEAPANALNELRVGIAPNYPPLAFKKNGAITGVEAQFAQKLGTELGIKVTLVETPFTDLIPALLAKRIDVIMSGMSITDERQQQVGFAHAYLRVGQMLLLRKADAQRFKTDATLDRSTTKVGAVRGTTGGKYAQVHLPRAKLRTFEDVDSGVAALRSKRIDAFIHDAPSIWQVTGGFNHPERQLMGRYEPLTEEYLAWATRKDDKLRDRLNTILYQWHKSGELEKILNRWIKTRPAPVAKPVKPAKGE